MFVPTTGAEGIIHRSKSEAGISFKLQESSIVARDDYYPFDFTDSEGTGFRAMSDFYCPATGMFFEFKSGHMNGLKNKTSADNAMARFQADKANGYITKSNENKKLLDASWSASVQKFKAVQYQAAEAGRCVVLIFDKKPDADTVSRLNRAKVFWCIYGDQDFRDLMSFRTLAKIGFQVEYEIKGHVFRNLRSSTPPLH